MVPPEEYELYGDRSASGSWPPGDPRTGRAAPVCPNCGANDHEDGFLENVGDARLRYFAGPRVKGIFGVRRLNLERRAVVARRCLVCSRLDLFADDVE